MKIAFDGKSMCYKNNDIFKMGDNVITTLAVINLYYYLDKEMKRLTMDTVPEFLTVYDYNYTLHEIVNNCLFF